MELMLWLPGFLTRVLPGTWLGLDKLEGGWGGARGGVPSPLPPQCFASGPPHKDPVPGFLGTAPPCSLPFTVPSGPSPSGPCGSPLS